MFVKKLFNYISTFLFFFEVYEIDLVTCNSTIGDGHCIWYGKGAKNPDKPNYFLSKWYTGDPKLLLNRKLREDLTKACPELVEDILDYYGEFRTCCNLAQLTSLLPGLEAMHVILGNCPACFKNLRQHFCSLSCHPRQSAFMNPTLLYENESVWEVKMYTTHSYVDSTYYSCENVYFPQINGPAMNVLCGQWGIQYCTPERLFNYFGLNMLTPLNTTFYYTNEKTLAPNIEDKSKTHWMSPFYVPTVTCNTSDPALHCRCLDCEESCLEPPIEEEPKEYEMVGEIKLYVFIIILIYSVFCGLVILFGCVKGFPGRGPEGSSIWNFNHKISAKFEKNLQKFFQFSSLKIANHIIIVLSSGAVVIFVLSMGMLKLEVVTNPVDLWCADDSRTRLEMDYFNENFGPFMRTNQMVIAPVGLKELNVSISEFGAVYNGMFGPVFNSIFLEKVLDLQLQIMNLTAEYEGKTVTLNDICLKPLAPVNDECVIQSILNYFQNDPQLLKQMLYNEDGSESFQYLFHLLKCFNNPSYTTAVETCLATYGGVVFPYIALGGFLEENETIATNPHYQHATALVITFVEPNYLDKDDLGPSLAWEKVFLDFLKGYENSMMDIAYYSQRSPEDEVKRESKTDISTVLISYIVMFAYVAISLGIFDMESGRIFIKTKVTLGLCGVILVLLSVFSAIGFWSYVGMEATLFIVEVLPFLAVAVGVDNIFLLVQKWQREKKLPNESIEEHVARIVGKVAPSMLIATSCEVICFFLGAISDMPAIFSFSIYAGTALLIDFLLQVTCLVALIVLDARRENSNRYDVACCLKSEKPKLDSEDREDVCVKMFKILFARFLLNDIVRGIVLLLFVGAFCTSCVFVPEIDIGLEEELGMPEDSYLLKYFDFLDKYLSVGPPVYFVVRDGFDFSNPEEQNIICQSIGCNVDSILAQVFWASEAPDVTHIATGASSWLDQYFVWISDRGGLNPRTACCRLDSDGNFINSSAPIDNSYASTCLIEEDFIENTNRPLPEYFMEYLPYFLSDNPHGTKCPEGGHPSYGSAVVIKESNCKFGYSGVSTCVGSNYFMAYHSVLKDSKDYTNALDKAYQLTDYMNKYIKENSLTPNVEIFPYSVFYVFYEQYLDMWNSVALSLSVSAAAVFLVMFFITGLDLRSSLINLMVIIMIVVDIMAMMVPWNIQLNPISLVNLVMAIGISVEFCNHVTHTFITSDRPTKVERAMEALVYTGSSVFSGIALTKFFGILVLFFANMQIITVFYFRMYLLMVLFGTTHGIIFLPVLLSLIGAERNPYLRNTSNDESENKEKSLSKMDMTHTNNGFDNN